MIVNYHQLADQFLEQQMIPLKVVDLLQTGSARMDIEAINFIAALKHASDPNKVLKFYVKNNILENFFDILQKSQL